MIEKKSVISRGLIYFLILVFVAVFLGGCYDSRETDDLAYVVAIGIDKGKTNALKMTVQVVVPKSLSGKGGGGGDEKDGAAFITTVETPSIYSGFNMINNHISRQLNLSHAKLLVISEELARGDIESYIRAISRGREFRPTMYVSVCTKSAEDYITEAKPQLETSPSKYYELTFRSYSYTAMIPQSIFQDFYNRANVPGRQPVAVLSGINDIKKSDEFGTVQSTFRDKGREFPLEGDFVAGQIPRTGKSKSEIMGTAVFNGYKMAGILDGEETADYLMCSGEYKYANFTIPDPLNSNKYVLLNLSQSRKPVKKVDISGGVPFNRIDVKLEADILAIQSGLNYENPANTPILEQAAEQFIKGEITRFLEKTSGTFGSDICGFGEIARRKFINWKDWEAYDWNSHYPQSSFDVNVDVQIRRSGLLIKTTGGL